MARKTSITRDMIIAAGVDFVTANGIDKLNVRILAEQLGCSIQPIFKNFGTMEVCKAEIVHSLEDVYRDYIVSRIDHSNWLLTESLAHVNLAIDRRYVFELIFQAGTYHTRTVSEVIKAEHNRQTIECTALQFGVDTEKAEEVYRDVRFYSLGLAQAAYAGSVHFEEGECERLIRNAIAKFLR